MGRKSSTQCVGICFQNNLFGWFCLYSSNVLQRLDLSAPCPFSSQDDWVNTPRIQLLLQLELTIWKQTKSWQPYTPRRAKRNESSKLIQGNPQMKLDTVVKVACFKTFAASLRYLSSIGIILLRSFRKTSLINSNDPQNNRNHKYFDFEKNLSTEKRLLHGVQLPQSFNFTQPGL